MPSNEARSGNDVGATTPSREGSNWGAPVHGTDSNGNDVTASFGVGKDNQGETFLADGHLDPSSFMDSGKHDHYGSGSGRNENGTDHGKYSG